MSELPRVVSFGPFSFDRHTRELHRDGTLVRLQEQPARVLAVLIEHPGDLVTREELRRTIWGEETFVDFNRGLNYCISQIRLALGDTADGRRYIETLRGRGYRFMAVDGGVERRPVRAPKQGTRWPKRPPLHQMLAVAVFLLLVPLAVWLVVRKPAPTVGIAPFVTGSATDRQWADRLQERIAARLSKEVDIVDSAAKAAWRVEGRIDRAGTRRRVTVALRDLRNGSVPWSDVFEGPAGQSASPEELADIVTMIVGGHAVGDPPRMRRPGQWSPAGDRFRSEK